jgi:serine/threonine protein phosphatase PrpC
MDLRFGVICDRGLNPKRPVNQDRFLALPYHGLFAVFDGVGGQRAGEVASQTAAETIEEALNHAPADSPVDTIQRAIQFANRDIFEMAAHEPGFDGMATTVALVHFAEDGITIAHVGDSRVYRLADGRLHRETIDHTDFDDAVRNGISAAQPSRNNVINRALGVEPGVELEIKSSTARDGEAFLICSDGVYRHLSDDEIAAILSANNDPQVAAAELKRQVYERGADDNLTAVIVRPFGISKEPAASTPKARRNGGRGEVRASHRFQVEVAGQPNVEGRTEPSASENATRSLMDQGESTSAKRPFFSRLAAVLVVSILIVSAFYAGLRASHLISGEPAGRETGVAAADPFSVARDAFDEGNYEKAGTIFANIVEREPNNALVHYWLGRARLETGDYAAAAQGLEKALELSANEHISRQETVPLDAHAHAAAAYWGMGDKTKAEMMLERYTEARKKPGRREQSPAPTQ